MVICDISRLARAARGKRGTTVPTHIEVYLVPRIILNWCFWLFLASRLCVSSNLIRNFTCLDALTNVVLSWFLTLCLRHALATPISFLLFLFLFNVLTFQSFYWLIGALCAPGLLIVVNGLFGEPVILNKKLVEFVLFQMLWFLLVLGFELR